MLPVCVATMLPQRWDFRLRVSDSFARASRGETPLLDRAQRLLCDGPAPRAALVFVTMASIGRSHLGDKRMEPQGKLRSKFGSRPIDHRAALSQHPRGLVSHPSSEVTPRALAGGGRLSALQKRRWADRRPLAARSQAIQTSTLASRQRLGWAPSRAPAATRLRLAVPTSPTTRPSATPTCPPRSEGCHSASMFSKPPSRPKETSLVPSPRLSGPCKMTRPTLPHGRHR